MSRYIVQKIDPCPICDGTGRVRFTNADTGNPYSVTCSVCFGQGNTREDVDLRDALGELIPEIRGVAEDVRAAIAVATDALLEVQKAKTITSGAISVVNSLRDELE